MCRPSDCNPDGCLLRRELGLVPDDELVREDGDPTGCLDICGFFPGCEGESRCLLWEGGEGERERGGGK